MNKEDKNPSSDFDSYSPSEIAKKIELVGVLKARLDFFSTFILAMLAGSFISLGGMFSILATSQVTWSYPFTQLLGGLTFSLGLILVVVAGAELFTGNNLIVMAFASRRIGILALLRNWGIVYFGNHAGAILTSGVLYLSRAWATENYLFGARALLIANRKASLSFVEAFFLGILCNILVCLAVWLAMGGRSVTDKILAIIFPISAFVAMGFEHSIANMYFITFGLMVKSESNLISVIQASGKMIDLSNLNYLGMISNLLPTTLGNIIGGSLFVGVVYWLIYLRPRKHS